MVSDPAPLVAALRTTEQGLASKGQAAILTRLVQRTGYRSVGPPASQHRVRLDPARIPVEGSSDHDA